MAKRVKDKKIVHEVALRLSNLRTEKGMTLQELAHEADIELTQVHRVLNGNHDPQLSTVEKIVKALGSDMGTLFKGL